MALALRQLNPKKQAWYCKRKKTLHTQISIVILAIKNVETESGKPLAVFIIDDLIPSLMNSIFTSKSNTRVRLYVDGLTCLMNSLQENVKSENCNEFK